MKAEILATLEEYASAYCAKDADRLMALFDDSEDISVIGTGADELCHGTDAIRALFLRNFSEATAKRFEWHWRKITIRGETGVVATTLTIHLDLGGQSVSVPLRWTVVVNKTGDHWLWLHRHASLAAGDQDDGKAYPIR